MAKRLETNRTLRASTYWVSCVPVLYLSAEARLAQAIEAARAHFPAELPAKIYVHPKTARETPAREGIELVAEERIGRYDYWFPTSNRIR